MATSIFVDQLYSQILLRPADTDGHSFWTGELESSNALAVTERFIQSDEYQSTVATISSIYFTLLGRVPDYEGLSFWVNELQNNNQTVDEITAAFLSSPEAESIYGVDSDNSSFLNTLYQQSFGREPDAEGKVWWMEQLDNGTSRAEVVTAFSRSEEFSATNSTDQQTSALYMAVLNRAPTSDELTAASTQTSEQLLTTLYTSNEYSGAPLPGQTSGKVIDGYVSGATVFMDRDGDGQLDADENNTTTDEDGDFTLFGSGTLISIGGTDISTGKAIKGVMKAPDGSTVISPVTTVMQNLVSRGQSTEQAQDLLSEKMGLDNSLDLRSFDPLAAASDSSASDAAVAAALQLQSANLQLATTLTQSSAVLEGAFGNTVSTEQAVSASVEALTQQLLELPDNTQFDLTDSSLVASTLRGAAQQLSHGLPDNNTQPLIVVTNLADDAAQILTDANQRIDSVLTDSNTDPATAIENAVKVQTIAQGEATDALLEGAKGGSLSDAVDNFSGNGLDNQIDPPPVTTPSPPTTPTTPTTPPVTSPTDSDAPVFQSATINGNTLTLSYTDASNLDSASTPHADDFALSASSTTGISILTISINGTAKTVTLGLSKSVVAQETVSISYTPGSTAIQDVHDNAVSALTSQSVTNDTPVPVDTTAPALQSMVIDGDTLVLTYTDASDLDTVSSPHPDDFVLVGEDKDSNPISGLNIMTISINSAAKTVTLGLSQSLSPLDTITLSYTPGNNPIQDTYNNAVAAITAQAVTNESPATVADIDTVIASLSPGDKVKLEDSSINLDGKLDTSWITNNASSISEISVTNGLLALTAEEFDAAVTNGLPLADSQVDIDLSGASSAHLATVLSNPGKIATSNITSLTLADDATLQSYRDALSDDAIADDAITLTDGTITTATETIVSHSGKFADDTITDITLTPVQLDSILDFDAFNTDAITLDASDSGAMTMLQLTDNGDALEGISGLDANDTVDFSSLGIQFSNLGVSSGGSVIGSFAGGLNSLTVDVADEWQLDTTNGTLTWWDAGQGTTDSIFLMGVFDISTDGSSTITIF